MGFLKQDFIACHTVIADFPLPVEVPGVNGILGIYLKTVGASNRDLTCTGKAC